jgi:hypothetical protein
MLGCTHAISTVEIEDDFDCSTRRQSLPMVDISSYASRIHDDEDRPLFEDAVRAAQAERQERLSGKSTKKKKTTSRSTS